MVGRGGRRKLAWAGVGFLALGYAGEAVAQSAADLQGLSIEQLADLPVTTVSRREEALSQAPAAVYVITHEEIVRSGAKTLPDILRLAPNLFVAQTSSNNWVITARGLSGNQADQSFSNKLLVLVDGRTVYSPLYSGVYWDMQDVLPEDIERIEVISGPGGTLWGANAENGVINIITRSAKETKGGYASVSGGSQESSAALRFGGELGDQAAWRVYAHAFRGEDTVTSTGAQADDRWERIQSGFRMDWDPNPRDSFSFHGDGFTGAGVTSGSIGGGNLFARWDHDFGNSSILQVQTFIDDNERGHDLSGGIPFRENTYDLDVQDQFDFRHNSFVIGTDLRNTRYEFQNTPTLRFYPSSGSLDLSNAFAQDTFAVTRNIHLIGGLKLENDPYAHLTALPNLRLRWDLPNHTMIWSAVSQAIRAPTPFDENVAEYAGTELFLSGNTQFKTEKLTAYEVGARMQPIGQLSLSLSLYHDVYDDLRSIEVTPVTFLPIYWGNSIAGHVDGLELWGNYQATSWWRLSPSINLLSEVFNFKPGAGGLLGLPQVGDDPRVQAQLKSALNLWGAVSWDAELRYQSALPDPRVPAYVELNSRLAWPLSDRLELSIVGFNLLHAYHLEFPAPQANAVPRSVMGQVRCRF